MILKCACGKLQGEAVDISPTLNRRFVCYCRDCQAFTHFLGNSEHVLDANGGTEVIPFHPAQLRITQGQAHLACVRLSSDGMYRWYADCCKTPIANTQTSAKVPFAGVIYSVLGDEKTRAKIFGDVVARVQGNAGVGELPKGASMGTPVSLIFRALALLLIGLIRKRATPSPFFTGTGEPRVKPTCLPDSGYGALVAKAGRSVDSYEKR